MEKISTKFFEEKVLKSGMFVSSSLIPKMEIYGFIAIDSSKVEEIDYQAKLNDIVDTGFANNVVCGDRLMQTLYLPDSKGNVKLRCQVVPIFDKISHSESGDEYKLIDIYIPSLTSIDKYMDIRSRRKEYKLDEYNLRRFKFPYSVTSQDGTLIYTTQKNDILFLDNDSVIKGVSDTAFAVCKYINHITGLLSYAIFKLDELKLL